MKKKTPKSKTTKSVLERFDRAARSMAKAMNDAVDAGYQPGFLFERGINTQAETSAKRRGVSKAAAARIAAAAKKAVRK